MGREKKLKERKIRRKRRIKSTMLGTPERPRLAVYRSNKHIYATVIDDVRDRTITSTSSLDADLREEIEDSPLLEKSKRVGEKIAEKCKEEGIEKVVFDRNGFSYHGCVKNVAEGAREGGLKF